MPNTVSSQDISSREMNLYVMFTLKYYFANEAVQRLHVQLTLKNLSFEFNVKNRSNHFPATENTPGNLISFLYWKKTGLH